jgi:hypothetical protein
MRRTRWLRAILCMTMTAPLAGCYSSSWNWPEYDRAPRAAPADDPAHPLLGAWQGTFDTPGVSARAVLSTQPVSGLFGDRALLPESYSVEVRGILPGGTWWQNLWANVGRFHQWFVLARMREYKGVTMLQSPFKAGVMATGWWDGVNLTVKYNEVDPDDGGDVSWELHLHRPAANEPAVAPGPAARRRLEEEPSVSEPTRPATRPASVPVTVGNS